MSIFARCSCGKIFRAKDHHAGQRARCPVCGSTFLVPLENHLLNAGPIEEPAPAATADEPAAGKEDSPAETAWAPDEAGIIAGNPFGIRSLPGPPSWVGIWVPHIAFLVVLGLYFAAFFLPAIEAGQRTGFGQWHTSQIHTGLQAFMLALFPGIFMPPLALSWFANPLFLGGVLLAWLREWVAAAIAAFSASGLAILGGLAMVYLATLRIQCDRQVTETRFQPREGYFAWLGAMLLLGLICLAGARLAPQPQVKEKPSTLRTFLLTIGLSLLLLLAVIMLGALAGTEMTSD